MRLLNALVLLGLLVAALAWSASALAGGWSMVVADPLPPDITADADTTIGFTVLQHGRVPLSGQTPKIEAIHESGERVTATATGVGAPGHYVATLRFSQPGAWSWSVDVFEGPHMMAPITVKEVGAASAPSGSAGRTVIAGQTEAAAAQPGVSLVVGGWLPLAGAAVVIALVIALALVGLGFGRRVRGRLAGPTRT
jgi:hypothetical protein